MLSKFGMLLCSVYELKCDDATLHHVFTIQQLVVVGIIPAPRIVLNLHKMRVSVDQRIIVHSQVIFNQLKEFNS